MEEIPYQPEQVYNLSISNGQGNAIVFILPCIKYCTAGRHSMAELENIPGTGQDGRVSKKDILAYVAERATKLKAKS